MAAPKEDAYCTLLLNDQYLPGAMVLARSLRDTGTKKKLAALVIIDNLLAATVTELKKVYDYIIPVERITNKSPANLYLMNRPDLVSTFTKINLWKLDQFRKIVYVDADVVALRAPDELFQRESTLAAAPDIGWPDLFNSGVLVLTPNTEDYYALLALAQRGISFDGADQGLLNMHFRNYDRISFTYNCTPSGHYQYIPAYRHFQSSISMIHFIGPDKPWVRGRDLSSSSSPYEEMTGRWWAVYDRYYRAPTTAALSGQGLRDPRTVQQYVKGEVTDTAYGYSTTEPSSGISTSISTSEREQTSPPIEEKVTKASTAEEKKFSIPLMDWDPSKGPPPAGSRAEAMNFPSRTYSMSHDGGLFHAPGSYPNAPNDMWYQVPSEAPAGPKPIFPWEESAPKPTRVFAEDAVLSPPIAPSLSEISTTDDETQEGKSTPTTPTASRIGAGTGPGSDAWQTYSRGNAWDEVPDIERYVSDMQRAKKGKVQVLVGAEEAVTSPGGDRRPSMKLTDFPTEVERPSLPVTPAPIRRPSFWGAERDEAGQLPSAEGVPDQAEWDSAERLEELTRRTSVALPSIMNPEAGHESKIPDRKLPESAAPVASKAEVVPPTMPTFTDPNFAGSNAPPGVVTAEGEGGPSSPGVVPTV